jgi:hypothetical protein
MARTKKMVCHDCNNIFNRKPSNGDRQVCWKCKSTRVTLVTSNSAPPEPTIPQAPDPSGLTMPVFSGTSGGGAITPEMLLLQKSKLKHVTEEPVVLPGAKNSPIPYGVRVLAHAVKNAFIPKADLEVIWRERGSRTDRYAYLELTQRSVSGPLASIAKGLMNPEHGNFNDEYGNRGFELPTRKGPRNVSVLQGITYYEYGWKTTIDTVSSRWSYYDNGARKAHGVQGNRDINDFVRNVRGGRVFCERLIIAETGEVFYSPDHYTTFFRYHPGTRAWYQYTSAGGSSGPTWDESFYDEPYGV